MGITFNNPLNNIALVFLLGGFSVGAEAAKIGSPAYYLRTWGISPDATKHPLADLDGSNSTSLGFASHADAVNGQVTLTNDNDRIFVQAGVVNDGDTFAVSAYSARNYSAEVIYSGSAADVMVMQSYTKDTAEAKLTYTYTYAFGNGFVNPESGPGCPIGVTYCLNAGLFSTVILYDSNDVKIWSDSDFMQINQSGPGGSRFFRADTGGGLASMLLT